MNPFAGNFSNDYRFSRTNWLCRCLESKEDENHLISGNCEVYKDIRTKYENLENLEDLLNFFNEVLERRDKLDDEENISSNTI